MQPLGTPYAAEITDDRPSWHVVKVKPGQEHVALKHMVARWFMPYMPLYETQVLASRGRPPYRAIRPLFPGYIFVFVWNIALHTWRLRECPGVVDLLYDGEQPAVIPDRLIDAIQLTENTFGLKRRKRRRWRKRRLEPQEEVLEVQAIRCYSALNVQGLDDSERNMLLHKALGLV